MESPLVEILNSLKLAHVIALAVAAVLMACCVLWNRVDALMFILVLSASLVGTTIPIVENIASLLRWLSVLLLFLCGLLFGKIAIPSRLLPFLAYVFIGFIFLTRAISPIWQFQRGFLLLIVAMAIPVAFSSRSYGTYRSTLVLIAVVASVFAVVNAISVTSHLSDPTRLMGYSKGAPSFAVILGGLLPFSFWGLWSVRSSVLKLVLGVGFLSGAVTLALSGQRAGTVAGVVGLIPLIIVTTLRKRNVGWSLLVLALLFLLGSLLVRQSSVARINFLLSRYSFDSGLSNRGLIWQMALSEIAENPLLGKGIGAAEWVISSSFHNAYLEVWFNAGLLGLVFFLIGQIYLFYRISFLIRISPDPEKESILALGLGYMLGFLVLCVFESIGAGASNLNVVLYWFLAVLVSHDALFRDTSLPLPLGIRTLTQHPMGFARGKVEQLDELPR